MDHVATLSVGDTYHLRVGKDRIVCAGMPTENVDSIVQMKWELLCRGYAWNLFVAKEERRVRIDGVNLVVASVGPSEISFRARGRSLRRGAAAPALLAQALARDRGSPAKPVRPTFGLISSSAERRSTRRQCRRIARCDARRDCR